MRQNALLALEDGSLFHGVSIGVSGQSTGEVVFNTAMTGYQEILTDPSYCQQIVTLTYPHIGNVGTNAEDEESKAVHASGLVIRDLPMCMSNWRAQEPLQGYLVRHQVVAIADIDTRRLTRILREKGAQRGCIVTGDAIDQAAAIRAAEEGPGLKGMDLAKVVTTREAYEWCEGSWRNDQAQSQAETQIQTQTQAQAETFTVLAYDFGVKTNILRLLVDRGCKVTVIPATTPASEVLAHRPDGVFLSNGPGDPEPCGYAIEAIQTLVNSAIPVFGICLGHQLLSLACGGKTLKMKFGHHGANHPVQDLQTGRVMITSQNHGFAVHEDSLSEGLQATHRSLFDGSLQGIRHRTLPAFGFQGHPEASPGPHDIQALFDDFIALMSKQN